MKYVFKASKQFWKAFHNLPAPQQKKAKDAFKVFRNDPFDVRLRTHKINSLSARYKRTVFSVSVEGDLRSVFFLDGNIVYSVDIGTHAIYGK